MPRNAILVLDVDTMKDVEASTIEALTGAGYANKLAGPELVLDFFDRNAKTSTKAAFSQQSTASSSPPRLPRSSLRPKKYIHYDKLQLKKEVLRVVVQRVDECDKELLA
ncbi:hypothetical protein ABL78_1221 [Leptomonas seymouri]|uniref:Uncharacterized protein n=1 Tax=Leptomonas seymouri TaxID=5684 RepID=A0A0N1IM75_LEPSE|nr:hypothetical protein ABL78_1221 [Leptomonas seymouri]|eukprot:KPI89640.1 hypothetical protein ABL78_1221 [Leptomonas seymouri]